jgi:hypothetical protein
MAIISVGYDGAVTESQWSDMIKKVGTAEYGVVGLNDWKVTSVTGATRTVSIASGKGWGHGVFDENTSNVTIALDSVSSGSRWDLIVMRRDWTGAGGSSTFTKVNGTTAQEIPTGRTTGPGAIDDQPIALVQISSGSTLPTAIIDLRVWAGNGGMIANSELALSYIDSLASQVFLNTNGDTYNRVIGDDGNPMWTVSAPDGYIPMFGVGNTLSGGIPDTGDNMLVQSGTTVNVFDNSGYARVIFPRPFPNGLLYVSAMNADDASVPGMHIASAGGSRMSWTYRGVTGSPLAGGAASPLSGMIHRVNWLAIGW